MVHHQAAAIQLNQTTKGIGTGEGEGGEAVRRAGVEKEGRPAAPPGNGSGELQISG